MSFLQAPWCIHTWVLSCKSSNCRFIRSCVKAMESIFCCNLSPRITDCSSPCCACWNSDNFLSKLNCYHQFWESLFARKMHKIRSKYFLSPTNHLIFWIIFIETLKIEMNQFCFKPEIDSIGYIERIFTS